jgi:putative two-component system response regulator
VRDYSLALAAQLGWQGRMLEPLRFSATLHDIGKIHISKVILTKPGRLDASEWEEIKKHPIYGADLIQDIPYLAPAVPVIRHHHERWDGRGYPYGLAGEAIPLAARLIAVADAFDAMTFTGRPYARARSLENAYREIQDCSGAQFDPTVVSAFQEAWEAGKILPIWESWFGVGREK